MDNKNSKLAAGAAVLFEIILIAAAVTSILSRQWKDLLLHAFFTLLLAV